MCEGVSIGAQAILHTHAHTHTHMHYRYNVEVMDGAGVRGGGVRAEVRITSVAPQDSSVIACTATNKYGSHIHHMELRVQGEPHR